MTFNLFGICKGEKFFSHLHWITEKKKGQSSNTKSTVYMCFKKKGNWEKINLLYNMAHAPKSRAYLQWVVSNFQPQGGLRAMWC